MPTRSDEPTKTAYVLTSAGAQPAQVASLLDQAGWSVRLVTHAMLQPAKIAENPPSLIVVEDEGVEEQTTPLELLKFDQRTNPIPVICIEPSADRDLDRVIVRANLHLAAPFTDADFAAAVAEVLRQRQELEARGLTYRLHLEFSSHSEHLMATAELLAELLVQILPTTRSVSSLRQAIVEIGQNAIEWGNKGDRSKSVAVWVEIDPKTLAVAVEDEGEGFDPGNLPHAAVDKEDPTEHLNVREILGLREGGFGLQIARGIFDELRYNDRGNRVTLIKHLDPAPN